MATIRVKNPNQGGEKWIAIPTKIQSEADHIVTNKGQGDLYLSNDGTYKDVIKSANDYTDKQIELITGSSPDILETLKELSNQTSDNKDFIDILNKSIATKLDKTANAVSASKLATPIKLWGNDFDGSQSVYGNLYASNGNQGLSITNSNVVLGNFTNPSYIYGSSIFFRTNYVNTSIYIDSEGKVGIGTANPQQTLDIIGSASISGGVLIIKRSPSVIKFNDGENNTYGYIGMDETGPIYYNQYSIYRKIWHEGNLNPFDLSNNTLKLGKSTNLNQSYAELVSVASESSDNGVALRYHRTLDYLGRYSGIQIDSSGIWYDKTGGTLYKIWNEDNDGKGSGLDADMLDGKHLKDILNIKIITSDSAQFDLNSLGDGNIDSTTWYYAGSSNVLNQPWGNSAATVWTFPGSYSMQVAKFYNSNEFKIRGRVSEGWSNWKQLAFTDSNITGNAATATKLAKPVKLWGQSFDGSSDISEYTTPIMERINFSTVTGINEYDGWVGRIGDAADIQLCTAGWNYLFLKTNALSRLTIAPNGDVGIGTTDPRYKLDVNGIISCDNYLILGDKVAITDDIGKDYVLFGSYTYNSYVRGKSVNFQFAESRQVMSLSSNGNVGIGTTNPQYTLDVVGGIHASDRIILENNKGIAAKDTQGRNCDLISLNGYDIFNIGYGIAGYGYKVTLDGDHIYFRYGTSRTNGMILNSSGGVTIGENDKTQNVYKLYVDGHIGLKNSISVLNENSFITCDNTGAWVDSLKMTSNNKLVLGNGTISQGYKTIIAGNSIHFETDSERTSKMIINHSGNVGIGTDNPQSKLDVNGNVNVKGLYSSESITIANSKGIYIKDSSGNSPNVLQLNTSNNLLLGYGSSSHGYKTTIEGNTIYFKYGTSHSTGIILNSSGNVTIGSTDLASTASKLYVDGHVSAMGLILPSNGVHRKGTISHSNDTLYIQSASSDGNTMYGKMMLSGTNTNNLDLFSVKANNSSISGHLSVHDYITSGELVDWYGVSWSEDSSDPTCTRIGNMALHRSLPIQSAMKGYVIGNKKGSMSDMILPLSNDWTKVNYDNISNSSNDKYNNWESVEKFIKIPEFWYIDDYEPDTKTHNLKISQTAKAGWCHHKEAYVGTYEGYNDGTYYRSIKNVIPTVSKTREQLRTAARANGYENEYKWNIYTYEEHKAICHLFLVEYATRNSQLAVNPELTSDGFKQGGLGSGCTTGAVTINGQTVYSFIPTGTTDSLGNGSGQVAYTVTQTDENGNETGTVTRYANRYRGIENPFGHIWKHVDDIVNFYNAKTTYKTVYKCNKPEHFATNKNAKYKPLCSLPGGSKMQGWSKEIKATINCDFFKYSVGGNESTYWCDYNYDNDDTSEHCLLIGGHSGHGGLAGLFSLGLHNGVGFSDANVGSRLTYLPWAE